MTDLQAVIYTMGYPILMLLIGFIMGRMTKETKILHGHFSPVPDKAQVREDKPKIETLSAINKAFGRKFHGAK